MISVSNLKCNQVLTEGNSQQFTNEYKYSRTTGLNQEFIQTVPFSKSNIPVETDIKFQKQIPKMHELLLNSNQNQMLILMDKW